MAQAPLLFWLSGVCAIEQTNTVFQDFSMNSNNTPPLPQPSSFTCSNCGFGWNEDTAFCPRCGAAQTPLVKQRASTGVLVAYGCGFITLGAMGACFSLFGLGGAGLRDWLNPFSLVGVALVAGALFLLWKLVRGGR